MESERFGRQVILPEVGLAGQARIERGTLALLASSTAQQREVALVYARAAGLGLARSTDAACTEAAVLGSSDASHVFRHAAARDVGLGAWMALTSILNALDSDNTEEQS